MTRLCKACLKPLPLHNHGEVHARCAVAYKSDRDADAALKRSVREESSLLPWERHPIPWDNVRIVGGPA